MTLVDDDLKEPPKHLQTITRADLAECLSDPATAHLSRTQRTIGRSVDPRASRISRRSERISSKNITSCSGARTRLDQWMAVRPSRSTRARARRQTRDPEPVAHADKNDAGERDPPETRRRVGQMSAMRKPIMIGLPPPFPLHCTFRSFVNLILSLFLRRFLCACFFLVFPTVSIVPQSCSYFLS